MPTPINTVIDGLHSKRFIFKEAMKFFSTADLNFYKLAIEIALAVDSNVHISDISDFGSMDLYFQFSDGTLAMY